MIIDDDGKWLDEPEPEPKKKSGSKTEESHNPKFTGVWWPRKVLKLFWAGKLGRGEAMLLVTIDALCGSRGCFASNEYLGKQIRVSANRIAHMIGTLRGLGLVNIVRFDGRKRYLETKWNRAEKDFRGGTNDDD